MANSVPCSARKSIQKVVCRIYFHENGQCAACPSSPECTEIVDDTMKYTSLLAAERKTRLLAKNT